MIDPSVCSPLNSNFRPGPTPAHLQHCEAHHQLVGQNPHLTAEVTNDLLSPKNSHDTREGKSGPRMTQSRISSIFSSIFKRTSSVEVDAWKFGVSCFDPATGCLTNKKHKALIDPAVGNRISIPVNQSTDRNLHQHSCKEVVACQTSPTGHSATTPFQLTVLPPLTFTRLGPWRQTMGSHSPSSSE